MPSTSRIDARATRGTIVGSVAFCRRRVKKINHACVARDNTLDPKLCDAYRRRLRGGMSTSVALKTELDFRPAATQREAHRR
jgi:hypothetical protein